MSIGKEEAEKIIKDFNNIAPRNVRKQSTSKKPQDRKEVKSGKREDKEEDEEKRPKKSNMKLIIIVVVIILIVIIGIYGYMFTGGKTKLVKKTPNPPVGTPPPVQTPSQ